MIVNSVEKKSKSMTLTDTTVLTVPTSRVVKVVMFKT